MSGKSTEPLVGSPPVPKSEMDARLATRDLPPAEWIERAIASGMDPIVMWNVDKDTRAICCSCLDVAEDHPLTPDSRSALTAIIDELVWQGRVIRHPDPVDPRS